MLEDLHVALLHAVLADNAEAALLSANRAPPDLRAASAYQQSGVGRIFGDQEDLLRVLQPYGRARRRKKRRGYFGRRGRAWGPRRRTAHHFAGFHTPVLRTICEWCVCHVSKVP